MSDASTLKFAHGKGMSIGIYVCKLLASGLRSTYMIDYDKFNSECIKLDMELSKFVDYFRRGELKSLGLQDTGWEKIKKTLAL